MNRASTDMGNVSQVVPAIHPYIGIGSFPAVNHQPEFAAHCVGVAADRALLDALHRSRVDRARPRDARRAEAVMTLPTPTRSSESTTCSGTSRSRPPPTGAPHRPRLENFPISGVTLATTRTSSPPSRR